MSNSPEVYTELHKVISMKGFDYLRTSYILQEETILQPRLEELGYTNIKWLMGEYDSFGPLTRLCEATSPEGSKVMFIYG